MKRTKKTLNFSEDLINNLAMLGLNKYESSIWLALLTKNCATASELSEIANVPRSRSYDVLESLEKKGFVITKIGKPIKYLSVSPDNVLTKVKKSIKIDSEKKIKSIDDIKGSELFNDLNSLYVNEQKQESSVILLKGRINAYNTMINVINNAKSSVVIGTTNNGVKLKNLYFKDILKNLNKKKIKVEFVTPKLESGEHLDFLKDFSHNQKNNFSGKYLIVDNKHVFIGLDDNIDSKFESFDQVVYVTSEFLANSIKTMILR